MNHNIQQNCLPNDPKGVTNPHHSGGGGGRVCGEIKGPKQKNNVNNEP